VPVLGTGALLNVVILPLVANIGTIILAISLTSAILRYRLWEIDLVLNRGLVYVGVVIVLGLIFIGVVVILQAGLGAVLGAQQTTVAAMLSAGAVAILFNPARLRLQRLVDRQLFGLRVDLSQVSKANQQPDVKPGHRDTSNLIGKQLGPYEVRDLIGRGGMGEVYLASQPSLSRQVAIKILPQHLSADPEFRARFEREARIVANLHHPNIINVFDFGEIDGLYCMVMEYIQGQGLDGLLRERKVLPFEEALPIITQIADALDYAHSQGIIHRDIKPSNIMLRPVSNPPHRLHAILMDFGLTKLADSESGLTQGNNILGTLAYTAPEQITASGKVDHRADIYAFGVMCYEMLTGKQPFAERNQAALLFAHLQRPAPDPRAINPDLPPEVASAILQALAKVPDNRPQSTGVFASQLSSAALSKA
jgi:serine/threonine protein kinase